jgi:hypothetical protein
VDAAKSAHVKFISYARRRENQQWQDRRPHHHAETRARHKGQYKDNRSQRRLPEIKEH